MIIVILLKNLLQRILIDIKKKIFLIVHTMVENIFKYLIRSFSLCSICLSQCFTWRQALIFSIASVVSLCVGVGDKGIYGDLIFKFPPEVWH